MNETLWKMEEKESYPALAEDIRCGCLVIGGGLCGVLTAYLLGKRGIDTVLIEKERLGYGKTMGTTAKATVCHNLTYSRIMEQRGREAAEAYGTANRDGLRLLRELCLEDGAAEECDARNSDFFLYSLYGERHIHEEARAMREAGIDCTVFHGGHEDFELPVSPKSGILLRDQLTFHPIKTVRAIAAKSAVRIFEQTEAVSKSMAPSSHMHIVKTAKGHSIHASKVIVATNYPVLVPGSLSFLKLYRETSYAAVFEGAPLLSRMYYGIDGGYHYRSHGEYLIVSGERHRTAPVPNAAEKLTQEASARFGSLCKTTEWSNNDTYTHDGIPYVGEMGDGMFVASGFGGWGMTNSASAARILSALAAGEVPRTAWVFSPSRNPLKGGADSLLHHIGISVSGMAKRFTVPELTAEQLRPGCAGIVSHNGGRAGAYRDEEGQLHLVSLKCPHLGCSLEWNGAAKTWDCPCHGSRFFPDGSCIGDPAKEGIALKKTIF